MIFFDYLGNEYISIYKLKSFKEIFEEYGVIAYTGTILSKKEQKNIKEHSIANNDINSYKRQLLGIIELSDVYYSSGCAHAPKINLITQTLIPYDLKMTRLGNIMLHIHEFNRVKVYENIYNNYIRKIESIRCSFVYSEQRMNKFREFYKRTLRDAVNIAWLYGQRQLGNGKNAIGIDKDNKFTMFEDDKGEERSSTDFLRAYLSGDSSISKWVFHGFQKMHEVVDPSDYEVPPCPDFK